MTMKDDEREFIKRLIVKGLLRAPTPYTVEGQAEAVLAELEKNGYAVGAFQ